jgi:hypothetical protein
MAFPEHAEAGALQNAWHQSLSFSFLAMILLQYARHILRGIFFAFLPSTIVPRCHTSIMKLMIVLLLLVFFGFDLSAAETLTIEEKTILQLQPVKLFNAKMAVCDLENELEKETVIGRALLLKEKRDNAKKQVEAAEKAITEVFNRRAKGNKWLNSWYLGYSMIHLLGAPEYVCLYREHDPARSKLFLTSTERLTQCMIEVVESNGEASKIKKLEVWRMKVGNLIQEEYRKVIERR